MTSTLPSNRIWDEAESLIIGLDRASRTTESFASFYQQIVNEVSRWAHASPVALWVRAHEEVRCLASTGQSEFCELAANEFDPTKRDANPKAYWRHSHASQALASHGIHAATQSILPGLLIQLVIQWDHGVDSQSPDANLRTTITEVTLAIIELAASTYMREQLEVAMLQSSTQIAAEQSIAALYKGSALAERFHHIAQSLAENRRADRVSLLQIQTSRCELVATSASPVVDRRARLAMALRSLAEATQGIHEPIGLSVGQPANNASWRSLMDRYLIESGCRKIEVDCVQDASEVRKNVAVIITEWFDSVDSHGESGYREHAHHAIRQALHQSTLAWPTLLNQFSRKLRTRRTALILTSILIGSLLLALLPVTFTLPVEGQVVPAGYRRIFAPAEGRVAAIEVSSGQHVEEGGELFVLRSSSIDLLEEQLRGELLTAKTRLASLSVSRSGNANDSATPASDSLSISANEQALKTEVAGLEKQLAMVEDQKRSLVIRSPMAGVVDRWDLEQSLANRPVTQGQHLIDIYATKGAWNVELDLPDQYVPYLGAASSAPSVTFRLKSQPDREYGAVVSQIAQSTHLNAQGKSVVRVKCKFESESSDSLAIGATVWADIECGKRVLGFVWFRGLFEWFERQAWY